MSENNGVKIFEAFLFGGILGSVFTFLYTPYNGEELRCNIRSEFDKFIKRAQQKEEDLVIKAKITADDLVLKAEQIRALAQKYAGGVFDGNLEKFEKEIKSLRAAFDAAFTEYKKSMKEASPTEEIVADIFSDYEDESLPKREGMRRRS